MEEKIGIEQANVNLPVILVTDKIKNIISCHLDESENDQSLKEYYSDLSIMSSVSKKQKENFKNKLNLDLNPIMENAITNEVVCHLLSSYIDNIHDFGLSNIENHQYIFSDNLTYNIDRSFDILDSTHKKDEQSNPIIIVSTGKLNEIYNSTDFKPASDMSSNLYIHLIGEYKGVPVWHNILSSINDNYAIVGYNCKYTLHYSENSLKVTYMADNNGNDIVKIVFSAFLENNDANEDYLTIQ